MIMTKNRFKLFSYVLADLVMLLVKASTKLYSFIVRFLGQKYMYEMNVVPLLILTSLEKLFNIFFFCHSTIRDKNTILF